MAAMKSDQKHAHHPLLLFLFLLYLGAACLVLAPLADINAAKWFIIRLLGTTLFAGWLFARIWTRRPAVAWDPLAVLGVSFLVLHVLSLFAAVNVGYGIERISDRVGLLATFFLAAHLCRERRARVAVLWMLLAIGAVTSVYGIVQHFGYDLFMWQTSAMSDREVPIARGVSFFGHPTFAASVLIQIIPIGIGLAIASGWPARILASASTLVMLYHLSFSGARMATVAFLLALCAAGAWWFWHRRSESAMRRALSARLVLAVALVAVVLGIAGAWLVARAWEVKGSDVFAIRQSSLALRFYNWETASRMFVDNMVSGVGAGNYEIVSPKYWNDVEQMRTARHGRWMQQAHNDYLQTAVELGVFGVAVLLAILAYAVMLALLVARRAASPFDRWTGLAVFAAVAAIAIDANTTFSLQAPGSALVHWTVLGIISAMYVDLPTQQMKERPGGPAGSRADDTSSLLASSGVDVPPDND